MTHSVAPHPTGKDRIVRLGATLHAWRAQLQHRLGDGLRDERGEGVISMAIAILIVAFLGVAAWLAFKGILDDTGQKVQSSVDQVGR